MQLCSHCRKRYHLFQYQTCFNCIPSCRKKELRESEEQLRKFEEEMAAFERAVEEA